MRQLQINCRGALVTFFVVTLMAFLVSCGTGSVNALRDVQDAFSSVAEKESTVEGQHFERRLKGLERNELEARLAENIGWEQAPYFLAEYGKIRDSLVALMAQDSAQLASDKLLGVAMTIEIYSRWRMAYYAHLLHLVGQLDEATANDPTKMIPLTEIAEEARQLADNNQVKNQLYPRDRFLLLMLPGMARFDASLLGVAQVQQEFKDRLNTQDHLNAILSNLSEMKAVLETIGALQPKAQAFVEYQQTVMATIQASFDQLKLFLPPAMRPVLTDE